MPKLNQILAVEKHRKNELENTITKLYQTSGRTETFNGMTRVYSPKDDEGDQLPGETVNMTAHVGSLLFEFAHALGDLFDATATKVYANQKAVADVKVGDQTILSKVPVEYLLFLEKRLADTIQFLGKLPTLDPAVKWEFDVNTGTYRSEGVRTTRTKKVFKNHVKAPATDKHPAQVEVFTEDVIVGFWDTTKFSGAVPVTKITEWKEKVSSLLAAVKFAREEANSTDAPPKTIGASVFNFLFGEQQPVELPAA